MRAIRRLIVSLPILCLVLSLAAVFLLPAAAAPVAHDLLTGANGGAVDNAAHLGGSDWQTETVDSAGDVGWDTSIAVDDSGNPHIAYYDSTNGTLKYALWTGTAWHIETVDNVGQGGVGYSAWDTSIALDGTGYPHISYCYSVVPNADGTLKYARWDGSSWDIETVDTAWSVGWYTSLALDSLEYPHISHYQDHVYDLRYSRWDGSSWDNKTVESSGMVGAHTSLALDADDYPHITYWDDLNKDLKYAYWDGAAWDIKTVDSTGNVGQYTSLVLDDLDHPHVSYVDRTNYNLKYACWNGSTWEMETVDASGVVSCEPSAPPQGGCNTSLVLSTDGYARISYHDNTYGDLEYAYWDGSGWQLETVDSVGDVGKGNSLALDTEGYPHISYYDATNGDLKYARGGEPTIPTTISVYTDKDTYSAGETMHFGLDMTTSSEGAPLQRYWLLILLRTPSTGVVVVNLPRLRLPSGWSYSNPDLFPWMLPALEPGSYTWIGMLIPVGEEAALDHAFWEFTGAASGQRVMPVEKALKRLRFDLDFVK